MSASDNLPQSVIEAFHLMWDNFPTPVSLAHKSREVVAVNKAWEKLGILKPGMNCAKIYTPDMHRDCLANQALASGEAAFVTAESGGWERIKFWLPLDGFPEFFVHFSIGSPETFRQAAPAKSVS